MLNKRFPIKLDAYDDYMSDPSNWNGGGTSTTVPKTNLATTIIDDITKLGTAFFGSKTPGATTVNTGQPSTGTNNTAIYIGVTAVILVLIFVAYKVFGGKKTASK